MNRVDIATHTHAWGMEWSKRWQVMEMSWTWDESKVHGRWKGEQGEQGVGGGSRGLGGGSRGLGGEVGDGRGSRGWEGE